MLNHDNSSSFEDFDDRAPFSPFSSYKGGEFGCLGPIVGVNTMYNMIIMVNKPREEDIHSNRRTDTIFEELRFIVIIMSDFGERRTILFYVSIIFMTLFFSFFSAKVAVLENSE